MTRKFKALGLALFAVLAMGAVMSSSASATEFTANSYPVKYNGQQTATEPHVFTADGYTTTCKNAEFSGEAAAASTTATMTPKYTECTCFGLECTVDMNGCDYLFHLESSGNDATVDLICPEGKEVTLTAGGGLCVVHVAPFTGKSHVNITNSGGGTSLRAVATVNGIHATLTDVGGFFCPFSGETTTSTATYTGNLTITGDSSISVTN